MSASVPPPKDHLHNLVSHLIGEVVTIRKKNGVVIEGMLDPDTSKTFPKSFALSLCCQLRPEQRILSEPKVLVGVKDVAVLRCDTFTVADGGTSGHASGGAFATDSGIALDAGSRATGAGTMKELRRWVPEGPEPQTATALDSKPGGAKWDQFAANERLFGVKTAFDESAYTTSIDRSSPRFQERSAKAELVAKDIQAAAARTANPHLIEERSGELLGDDADEEALYGAVLRDSCPPGFSIPAASPCRPKDQKCEEDEVVRLPSQLSHFEEERRKITQEFTAAQEELEKEAPIEVPQSIKSKLNPTAQAFVPSEGYPAAYAQECMPEYPAQQSYYYYYDEYGNCYCYNPYSSFSAQYY